MKKFYLICFAAIFGFIGSTLAQTHTAIFSGNWSDNSIWGPSGPPPNNCNNCTITINDGVDVSIDISFTMLGNSRLLIGSNGAFASSLTIPATSATSISAGHNIILSNGSGGNPTIKIISSLSSLRLTRGPGTTAIYDGVFSRNLPDQVYFKFVGLKPSLIAANGINIASNTPTIYGTSLPNAANPAPFIINSDGTLPVVLTGFNAVLNNLVVDLSWTTSAEINSDHFGIERSINASNWQTIGTVEASGFSSIAVNYSYVDKSPSDNANYYRLKIVDRDGKYKYSPIKVVNGKLTKGLNVFPNPANNFVNVTLGSDMGIGTTIRLINQFGQVLQEKKLSHAAGSTISLPVHNYPQGNYILQVTDEDGSRQTRKLLISR